jgi:hypothetical protein
MRKLAWDDGHQTLLFAFLGILKYSLHQFVLNGQNNAHLSD